MTKKEFYITVSELENEELAAFATSELEKMAATAEKRKSTPSKKALENAALGLQVYEVLTDEPMTAAQICEAYGEGVSVQKVPHIFKTLIADGKVVVSEAKVQGRKVKVYALGDDSTDAADTDF